MPDGAAVSMVYLYDETLWGLLCCVYDSYTRRERVTDILPESGGTLSLYPTRLVETDESHARRVYASLGKKLGPEGLERVQFAFRNCAPDRAYHLFRFICLGYRHGPAVCGMLGDESVLRVYKLHRSAWHEAHLLMGFVRFSEVRLEETRRELSSGEGGGLMPVAQADGGSSCLAAVIEPKHDVLSLLAEHFCGRYPEERFLIYDKGRKQALVYRPHAVELVLMPDFRMPQAAEGELPQEELYYRRLWKNYYDTIAIESRVNPKARMNHMAKRFWPNITEMQ